MSVEKSAIEATPTTGPIKAEKNRTIMSLESSICEKNQALTMSARGPERLKLISFRAVWKSMLELEIATETSSSAKYVRGRAGAFRERRTTIETMNKPATAYFPNSQNTGVCVMRHRTSAPVKYAATYAMRSGRLRNTVHQSPKARAPTACSNPTIAYCRIA